MSNFNERMAEILDRVGGPKLAEKTGISRTQLHRLKADGRETTRDNLIKIAAAADVDLIWLMTGVPSSGQGHFVSDLAAKYSSSSNDEISDDYSLIPVLNVSAAAGHGSASDSEDVTAMYAYRRDWLRETLGACANDLRIIKVQGESMAPTLRSGELIFVDTRLDTFGGDGIYVLRIGSDLLVKHLQRLPGQVLRVTSENSQYQSFDIRLDESSNDEVAIIGRVVWAVSGRRV